KLSDIAPSLGSLLLAADGNMYGTTVAGGDIGQGSVFKLTPAGAVTALHSFNVIDGANPEACLVQASDGKIYGTTFFGGLHGEGAIFSITTDGTVTTLYSFPSFDHVDGANPFGLMQHTDGKFYGTTSEGGTSINCDSFDSIGCGTVFSLDLGLGPFVTFVVPKRQGRLRYPDSAHRPNRRDCCQFQRRTCVLLQGSTGFSDKSHASRGCDHRPGHRHHFQRNLDQQREFHGVAVKKLRFRGQY